MQVIKPGIAYRLYYYSDKDRYIDLNFIEKVHRTVQLIPQDSDVVVQDGVVQFVDGITVEEIMYMLLDWFKNKNEKHYSKHNDKAIEGVKMIIGAVKERKKEKANRRVKYENKYKKELEDFKGFIG